MDIKPPTKRYTEPTVAPKAPSPLEPQDTPFDEGMSLDNPDDSFSINSKKDGRRKLPLVVRITLIVVAALVVVAGAAIGWYAWATAPVGSGDSQTFSVASGDSPSVIAKNLQDAKLIRSSFAFEIYVKLHGASASLQAGTYEFSSSQSVGAIVDDLVAGKNTTRNVFIPPGLTLKQLADPDVKGSFAAQGFSSEEIQQAFAATYTSPLLKDKPTDASLEGYIYPETFQIEDGDTLESVLQRSFDTLYEKLQADGYIEKFAAQGFNIHQALTMGSIIQEETGDPVVQKKVAQVFLNRLGAGMTLGSDVTFIYAARQMGVQPVSTLDSPYNTRIHTGLPPGPIATMNYSALQALADPTPSDYLFFVAGDDGTVYFSRTNEEHLQLVQQYCQELCSAAIQ